MPLYASGFFIPSSAGIPYILEDVYQKGGYRSVATVAERDAIKTAARKQGMLVYVREDNTLYEIPGTTLAGADAWKKFDARKYVGFDFKAPLAISEEFEVSIDELRLVPEMEGVEKGKVLAVGENGSEWIDGLPAGGTTGDAIVRNAEGAAVWAKVSGLPSTEGVDEGSALVVGEDGNAKWGEAAGGKRARSVLNSTYLNVGQGASVQNTIQVPSPTLMILKLSVDQPDITVELHSSPAYSDTNPYTFTSSNLKLEDDGITTFEDGGEVVSRRYGFWSANSGGDNKVYVRITNAGQAHAAVALQMTVLPME